MKISFWLLTFFIFCERQIYGFKSFKNRKDRIILFHNFNVNYINKTYQNNERFAVHRKNKNCFRNKINTSFDGIVLKILNEYASWRCYNKRPLYAATGNLEELSREQPDHNKEKNEEDRDEINNDSEKERDANEDEDDISYDLNYESVEKVLNLIRPKLQIDKGDVELVDIKGSTIYVKLLGNCVTCSSNSVTVSEVIKKTLKKYIRDENKKEPTVIITNFDDITEENIQKCLDQLKPYFDFIKIQIKITSLIVNKENISNSVSLRFEHIGEKEEKLNLPSNIRNEITERIKQKFPSVQVNFEN